MSQRQLADLAQISPNTVALVETGSRTPKLETFVRMLAVLGFRFVIVDDSGRPLETDEQHERLRDAADRRFPAHLQWGRPGTYWDGRWWGFGRTAWPGVGDVPEHTYWRAAKSNEQPIGPYSYGYGVWEDAT